MPVSSSSTAANNRPDGVGAAVFFLLLAAVLVVMLGYGVLLPILPFLLARALGDAGRVAISWHTGMLTAAYMFALFVFAPIWGMLSDRIGRRPIILAGLAGYLLAQVLFGLHQSLGAAYAVRAIAGASAAAVLPIVSAYVSDAAAEDRRARRFAWVSAASLVGLLLGPALSGLIYGVLTVAPTSGANSIFSAMLPLYLSAALGIPLLIGIFLWLPGTRTASSSAGIGEYCRDLPRNRSLVVLLILTLFLMFGLGSFEVGIALQGQQVLGLTAARIGLMFVECSMVMIIAQLLLFSRKTAVQRLLSHHFAAWGYLVMATGFIFLPGGQNFYLLLLLVGLIAAGSGVLLPLLAHSTSLQAGRNPGATLGMQTAAASLGQALGSVAGGWLFGAVAGASFWITAVLMLGAAATGIAAERGMQVMRKTPTILKL